jgi:6-phosphogluconate dehydrogenase
MRVGIIGLGKIGGAVAARLVLAGHEVYGYDPCADAISRAHELGVHGIESLQQLSQHVHVYWLFVPSGEIIDDILKDMIPYMTSGDIVIDGGNSKYTDSIIRARALALHSISFLDCGTSGGLQGMGNGFCLMVGGDREAYTKVHRLLQDVATPGGLAHVGQSGSGHYVKMVHNAIEYGIMQSYAEGIRLLKEGSFKENMFDLEEITRIWQHGSIIRSWILELIHSILERDQKLEHVVGHIDDTGTGRWAVEDARNNNIPVPVIQAALHARIQSRETDGSNYASKLVALLRHEFGGHPYKKKHDKQ